MRIVCVGLATVDLIYRVDAIPGPDEKAHARSAEIVAGGPATNAAVAAAALGADVTLVSAVGAHPLGDLIRADLDTCGVRLIDAAAGSPAPPPVAAITVAASTGARSIVSRGAADLSVDVPPGLDLSGADAILVDGHHPALALAAARAGRPLVVDGGSWRPVFAEVIPHATAVVCASAFRLPGGVPRGRAGAITDGPRPIRWWSGVDSGVLDVPRVDAKDTTGAGDVFHGALAVAVARDPFLDGGLVRALRFATAVAGVRVAHAGARAWLADPALAAMGSGFTAP